MLSLSPAAGGLDTDEIFSPFILPRSGTVIAAVSGGSDSTALLLLLHSFLARRHPGLRLLAATVDHGLRPEAAAEAEAVGRLADRLEIPHRTLRWEGPKPSTGIQAAARHARLRLLGELAVREEAAFVMLGHTADDQAETVQMRRARGGDRGLAGMAQLALLQGRTWLARPLLALGREALRGLLRADAIGWTDDPANADHRFERARLRGAGVDAACLALAAQAAAEREREGSAAAQLIHASAAMVAPGLVRLAPGFLDAPAALPALRLLLPTMGGCAQVPDRVRTETLLGCLRAGKGGTLAGACASPRRGAVFVYRESRDILAASGERGAVFDGRFRLREPIGGQVEPVGRARADREARAVQGVPLDLVRAALSAQPACAEWCEPVLAPFDLLLPAFDHAPASALARLLGAAVPPQMPYRRPIGRLA